MPRVLLGGLLAGLVMNVGEAALHAGILGSDTEALYKSLNVLPPNPAQTLPLLVALAFVLGIVSIWLYAATDSLYGSRVKSVVITGVAVRFFVHVWSGVYMAAGYAGVFVYKPYAR